MEKQQNLTGENRWTSVGYKGSGSVLYVGFWWRQVRQVFPCSFVLESKGCVKRKLDLSVTGMSTGWVRREGDVANQKSTIPLR